MRQRSRSTSRAPLGVILLLLLAGGAGLLAALHESGDPLPLALAPGAPVERAVRPGEVHAYIVRRAAGEVLHAVAWQEGADVALDLKSPVGRPLLSVDGPNGVRGPEDLFAVAAAGGEHLLVVRGGIGSGRYRLRLDPPRRATGRDRRRAAAAMALSEGDRLRHRGGAGDLSAAERCYSQASLYAGDAQLARLARYRLAKLYHASHRYREALAMFHDLEPAWRDRFEGDALLNAIGAAHQEMGRLREALKFYGRSAAQAARLGDSRGWRVALENQAEVYRLRGAFRMAIDLERRAQRRMEELGLEDERAAVSADIARLRLDLGLWQEAADESTRALAILERNGGCDRARAAQVLATAYVGLQQWQPAAERFQEARAHACDRALEVAAGNGLGWVYLKQGRLQEAAAVLEQALQKARDARYREGEGNALGNLGATYSRLGDTARALDSFARARQLYAGSPDEETSIQYGTAEALERAGRLDEASAVIAQALQQIEQRRTRPVGSDIRALFFASRQDYYELCIRVLMELDERSPGRGYDARAFEVSERTHARSLLDELAAAPLDPAHGAAPELLASQSELERGLAAMQQERAAAGAHDSSRFDDAISRLSSQLAEVRGKIRLGRVRHAAVPAPQPLGLRAIQRQVLDDGTLLLAYSLGRDGSFLWSVDRSSLHTHRLPGTSEIEKLARETYTRLLKSATTESGEAAAYDAGQLSQRLLGPVASELGGRRLLIVADGALLYIPFSALPEPQTSAGAAGGEPPPLFVAHEIVHLPSVSLVPLLRQRAAHRRPAAKLIAVLAAPALRSDERSSSGQAGNAAAAERGEEGDAVRSAHDVGMDRLEPLPFALHEAESILALAPAGTSLKATGFAASRDLATSPEVGRYKFVHFATHGFLDALHPELSGLVLSQVDARGRPRDGFLHAYEIYDLKLSADLVVLSACQTALGAEVRGEGLVGLTRGFMYAGAPRVMVSLWNINDHATAALMEQFYRGVLQRHLTPAAALRAAQLAAWKQKRWKAPYYWAAFELQGDWR